MAGNYPDVPSWRMAWDRDGTQAFMNLAQLTQAQILTMNDENGQTEFAAGDAAPFVIIFPELRDIDGVMMGMGTSIYGVVRAFSVQVSADTTNGLDGTWSAYTTNAQSVYNASTVDCRRRIFASTALAVKAIRFMGLAGDGASSFRHLHLYGEPAPGENLQRLEIWHPTLDQRAQPADLDWGDVPRNSSAIKAFRVKNMHGSLTANSVRVAQEILFDTAPSVVGQSQISKDGGTTWGAQQTLASPLGPGAISPVLQVRRTTPSNATLSLWWYRVFSDCLSWS